MSDNVWTTDPATGQPMLTSRRQGRSYGRNVTEPPRPSTWLDTQDPAKLEAALEHYRTGEHFADVRRYAGGDERFGLWLAVANRRALRSVGVSIFDLADYTWRDAFDAGTSPREALLEALEADDTFNLLVRGE